MTKKKKLERQRKTERDRERQREREDKENKKGSVSFFFIVTDFARDSIFLFMSLFVRMQNSASQVYKKYYFLGFFSSILHFFVFSSASGNLWFSDKTASLQLTWSSSLSLWDKMHKVLFEYIYLFLFEEHLFVSGLFFFVFVFGGGGGSSLSLSLQQQCLINKSDSPDF